MESNQSFSHKIRVNWHSGSGSVWWNETCAMVLEVFGLPGHKFIYKPYEDYMEFLFSSEKDAIMCKILLSDRL